MQRQRSFGVLRRTGSRAIWTLGVVIAAGQFCAAHAALLNEPPLVVSKLADLPQLDAPEVLGNGFRQMLERSDLPGLDLAPPNLDTVPAPQPAQPPPDLAKAAGRKGSKSLRALATPAWGDGEVFHRSPGEPAAERIVWRQTGALGE